MDSPTSHNDPPSDTAMRTVDRLIESVVKKIGGQAPRPLAMYRLQFCSGMSFADAADLVPYLHELGVTHVYASPYLRARRGSPHGYDICNHEELNPELGTTEDFDRFVAVLREHGMGHVLDFVPNHMSANSQNPWWNDVLENGPNSPYANFFDIDWQPLKAELAYKVLLPILGEQYGESLESGRLALVHAEGSLVLKYYDQELPVGPKSEIPLLAHRIEELQQSLGAESEAFVEYQSILTALQHLPPQTATEPQLVWEGQREKQVIKRRLRDLEQRYPAVAEFIERNVAEFNGRVGESGSFDRLDALVRDQAYRPCHWRAASDEVNYRRFFDINELAAICMEHEEVFRRTHRLVLRLLAEGKLDGLRIDHVDGLYEPTQYLWRLQWAYLEQLGETAYKAELSAAEESNPPPWESVRGDFLRGICQRLQIPLASAPDWSGVHGPNSADSTTPTAEEGQVNIRSARVVGSRRMPLYVVVEKILGADEPLPAEWPVAGTTGYDFLNQLNGLFIDPRGLKETTRVYSRFLGETLDFWNEVHRCKLLILRVAMSSELQMLAHRLNVISEQNRHTRDFTLNSLRHALREILSCFPVYRTYAGPTGVSERDRRFINLAVARAKRRNPAMDAALFDFIRNVLCIEHAESLSKVARHERELFTGRFQQVTSPVMAKGMEDTVFYVYCPLLSASEVGSHPPQPTISVEQFHHENRVRQHLFPDSMTTTSTHDTKRSEDVRARLNVLTEVPHQWRKSINQWARMNRRHRVDVDGELAPSRNDEYIYYQTLVGVWPTDQSWDDNHQQLVERIQLSMDKAIHEAKLRTSWVNPNGHYDAAVRDFISKTLERRKDNRFLKEFRKFIDFVLDWGLLTAVSQLTLKLLSPGVPDIYQGQELWDFSLVDPDNRRLADFAARRKMLAELSEWTSREGAASVCRSLSQSPRDSRLKLLVTQKLLLLRREFAAVFRTGEYLSLAVEGPRNDHLCAFAWRPTQHESRDTNTASEKQPTAEIVVVVPRLIAKLDLERPDRDQGRYPFTAPAWEGTHVKLDGLASANWTHIFSNESLTPERHDQDTVSLKAADLFRDFPVAVLRGNER